MIQLYFTTLLIPLKETSALFRALFSAIAKECDLLLAYATEELKGSFARFADSLSLPFFASERGIAPIRGESLEGFAKRTEKAFAFLSSAHTKTGITALIRAFTAKPFTVREIWTENWILGSPEERLGEAALLGGQAKGWGKASFWARFSLPNRGLY